MAFILKRIQGENRRLHTPPRTKGVLITRRSVRVAPSITPRPRLLGQVAEESACGVIKAHTHSPREQVEHGSRQSCRCERSNIVPSTSHGLVVFLCAARNSTTFFSRGAFTHYQKSATFFLFKMNSSIVCVLINRLCVSTPLCRNLRITGCYT